MSSKKNKLLIIGAKKYGKSTKMLMEEGKKRFETDYLPVNDIALHIKGRKPSLKYEGKKLKDYDYYLPRIDSKRAQHGYHVMKFMDILRFKKPYNAETVLIAHNKFSTLETMRKANIPLPETYLVNSISSAKKILKKMTYPVVVKIVNSFGGKGVMMLEDKESATSAIETLKTMQQQIIIEEFLKGKGEDIRAFIVGGEIIASMKRVAKKGELRANLFAGGKGKYITLTGKMKKIALRAAEASNSDIIAIDLMEDQEGPKVIEININPGIKGIQRVANTNVAEKIMKFVEKDIKRPF